MVGNRVLCLDINLSGIGLLSTGDSLNANLGKRHGVHPGQDRRPVEVEGVGSFDRQG